MVPDESACVPLFFRSFRGLLMPAVFRGGFAAQLLGRAAGRTAEPVEEEYMQRCCEYITEQRNVVCRLVAVVFFKGEEGCPAYAAFPGKGHGKVKNQGQYPGTEAEADDLPAPFSVEQHHGCQNNGGNAAGEEEKNGYGPDPGPKRSQVLNAFFPQVGLAVFLHGGWFGGTVAVFFPGL